MVFTENTDLVLVTLRKIIRAIDIQSKRLVRVYGLTGPQILVIKEIKNNPDKPISVLSKNISLSQATVTSILDRLEQQKFAIRIRDQKDKRKVTVKLTEKATDLLMKKPSLLQEEFTNKFEQLEDWEQSMILSNLQRLASMMNAENLVSSPVLVSGQIDASTKDVKEYLEEN